MFFLILLESISGDETLQVPLGNELFNLIFQLAAIIGVMPDVSMIATIQMSTLSPVKWGSDPSRWGDLMSPLLDILQHFFSRAV